MWRQPGLSPWACKGHADRQSTLPSWRLRAGAAGGNPEESSCPEEGSSHGQKEEKQRTGQPNIRGKDRRPRGRNVKEQTEVGALQTSPLLLVSPLGQQHPTKSPVQPTRKGREELAPRELGGGAVKRSQGIPVLTLALFLTSFGLN